MAVYRQIMIKLLWERVNNLDIALAKVPAPAAAGESIAIFIIFFLFIIIFLNYLLYLEM